MVVSTAFHPCLVTQRLYYCWPGDPPVVLPVPWLPCLSLASQVPCTLLSLMISRDPLPRSGTPSTRDLLSPPHVGSRSKDRASWMHISPAGLWGLAGRHLLLCHLHFSQVTLNLEKEGLESFAYLFPLSLRTLSGKTVGLPGWNFLSLLSCSVRYISNNYPEWIVRNILDTRTFHKWFLYCF
jgi:hypothetical protein